MRHRIFIAVNLSEDIKQKFREYQDKIEELFIPYRSEASGSGPVRWTKPENLHITLIFLGYLENEDLAKICQITKEVASKHQPFSISLNKIIYGPPKKMPPRMVWVEGEKSEELGNLRKDLETAVFSTPIKTSQEPENRSYTPHITLGRIRQWEFRRIDPEERPQIDEDISLNFEVNSIEVMESQLERDGPEYTILESFELKT